MTMNRFLSAMFAVAGIALVSTITDSPLVAEVEASNSNAAIAQHPLIRMKLNDEIHQIGELSALKKDGLSEDEILHMQHMLTTKVEIARTGHLPQSHQLMERKLAATADDMNRLSELRASGLDKQEIRHIQRAILHKLGHLQDEAFFVSYN